MILSVTHISSVLYVPVMTALQADREYCTDDFSRLEIICNLLFFSFL